MRCLKPIFLIFVFALVYAQCELYPDLSCHPGYNQTVVEEKIAYCEEHGLLGPNEDPATVSGNHCPQFCILHQLQIIGSVDKNSRWNIPEKSNVLNSMFGDDYGGELIEKIYDACGMGYDEVFYVTDSKCNSEDAIGIYECIAEAAKC